MNYLNPLRWAAWLGQFIAVYFVSIRYRQLLAAMPILLIIVCLTVLAFGAGRVDRTKIRGQVGDAVRRQDDETAKLLLRRLSLMGDQSESITLQQMVLAERTGDGDQAEAIARQLVSERESVDAAVWLLRNRYDNLPIDEVDSPRGRQLGELLRLVTTKRPTERAFWQPWANYLLATGQTELAIQPIERIASIQPTAGLQLASLQRRLGRDDDAKQTTQKTLDALEAKTPRSLDTARTAIAKAIAETSLQRFKAAAERLNETHSRLQRQIAALPMSSTSDDTLAGSIDDPAAEPADSFETLDESKQALQLESETVRRALGESLVVWADAVATGRSDDSPADPVSRRQLRLRILKQALTLAPDHPRVISLVSEVVLAAAQQEDDSLAALQAELIAGTTPGVSHFVQGTAALIRGDQDGASHHLELAKRQLPNSPVTLNNLAIALASGESERLEEALALIQEAIVQLNPTPLTFIETRGQIFLKLGRHLDAIADLERAVRQPGLAPAAHRSLAACYEAIGQPDSARHHREAAEAS